MQIKTETKVGIFVVLAVAVFMFMILGIGAFRLSTSGYRDYTVSFEDVSGLSRKAEVKIAGVKVGWVEEISLTQNNHQAQADIMVSKKYALYDNASAIVRQEGLIGTKYLEVIPGDPLLPRLDSGGVLSKPGREAVSIDELLYKFKNIATHVEQITDNFKEAFTGNDRAEQLKSTVEHISIAAEKFSSLATSLEGVATSNEESFNAIIADFQEFSQTLKEDMPSFKENLTRLSDSVETDFSSIANSLNSSAGSIGQAAEEARDGFQSMTSVVEKIDDGRGLLGKLVNEDEMYKDIKAAVSGMKNYLSKFETLGVIFDSHVETMHRPVDDYKYADSKGYFNVRVHTSDSFFYLAQIVGSERGFIDRRYIYEDYYDEEGNQLDYTKLADVAEGTTEAIALSNENKFKFSPARVTRERNTTAFGFQFGKIYKDLALRMGMFEGAFGVGADYYIPFNSDKIAWTTTFEMFDFKGNQRFNREDGRPHVKWMNRVFLLNNLYLTFGADDFVSKSNANAFWGIGMRFGDDDIKYLLSKFGLYITM